MRYLAPFDYFQAVAKAGSVRKAAEDLSLTSSALNRRIQDLEAELGLPLFDRHPGGLSLNAAGEATLRFVKNQRAEVSHLRAQIADLQGLKRGHLAFACSQALIMRDLPEALKGFADSHRYVTFDVKTLRGNEEEMWLREKEIEFAFCLGRVRGPEFETVMSVPKRIAACVADHHPLAEKQEMRLSDLAEANLALPPDEFRIRELINAAFKRRSLAVQPRLETDDFRVGQILCLISDFVTFRLIDKDSGVVQRDGFRQIPIALSDLALVEIQALKLRQAHLSPIGHSFIQAMSLQLGA